MQTISTFVQSLLADVGCEEGEVGVFNLNFTGIRNKMLPQTTKTGNLKTSIMYFKDENLVGNLVSNQIK